MQQKQGVRETLSLSTPRTPRAQPEQKRFDYGKKKPSGASRPLSHDRDIKRLKESGEEVVLTLVSGGVHTGVIVDSDKYSIKIKVDGKTPTYFKHAIESFSPVTR